jgi:hypothetical protein
MRCRWMLSLVLALFISTSAAHAQDWVLDFDLTGEWSGMYDGSMIAPGVNTDVDLTNFVGLPIIGLEFTILPNAGTTYDPDEFEQIFFHSGPPIDPNDVPPYVPPSIINLSTETVSYSNWSGFGYQTLRFDFPDEPVLTGELIQARFQIDWLDPVLFDLQITPIIPAPAAFGVFAMAGLCAPRRRRF